MWRVLIGIGVFLFGVGYVASVFLPAEPAAVKIDEGTMESIESYFRDYGVVMVSAPEETIAFAVPDEGAAGWEYNDAGSDTKSVNLTLSETSGKKEVHVTLVNWSLYGSDGSHVTSGKMPVGSTIEANGTTSVSISITLSEYYAGKLDDAAKPEADFTGSGTFEFRVTAADTEIAESARYIPGSAMMTVAKP